MPQKEVQELINKLAYIGYCAEESDKQSIFLTIASVYSSPEFAKIVKNHVSDILDNKAKWDPLIVNKIPNV